MAEVLLVGDGQTIPSPVLHRHQEHTATLSQPRRIAYRCGVHPTMHGEIVVQPR